MQICRNIHNCVFIAGVVASGDKLPVSLTRVIFIDSMTPAINLLMEQRMGDY
jgi:hypothetical protein